MRQKNAAANCWEMWSVNKYSAFLKKIITDFEHVYHKGHLTGTALTQMRNDYLKYIYNNNFVGAVLLDFCSAFVLDHKLLLDKVKCHTICCFLSNRKQ